MMDDEHRLIARYAARLAANANNAVSMLEICHKYHAIMLVCCYKHYYKLVNRSCGCGTAASSMEQLHVAYQAHRVFYHL